MTLLLTGAGPAVDKKANLVTNPSVETDLSGWAVASPAYQASVLSDSPLGYWRLNEPSGTSAADSSGSNTGTYNSGAAVATLNQAGPFGDSKAILCLGDAVQGNGRYPVRVPDVAALRFTTSFTLEGWVKSPNWGGVTAGCVVAGKGDQSTIDFQFTVNPAGRLTMLGATGTTVLSTNTWYHVAATYDNTNVRFYINGVLDATVAEAAPSTSTRAFGVGGVGYWIGNHYLSEVAAYNTVLSAARLLAHYTASSTGSHTGTGGETTFTVGSATLAQSAAWSSAGTKSARLTIAGATAPSTTLDSPSFAVTAGASYAISLDYNATTITTGNIPITVHWSDGTSSTAIATVTTSGLSSPSGSVTAPAGVTSGTIRLAPSGAGTYDISVDNLYAA